MKVINIRHFKCTITVGYFFPINKYAQTSISNIIIFCYILYLFLNIGVLLPTSPGLIDLDRRKTVHTTRRGRSILYSVHSIIFILYVCELITHKYYIHIFTGYILIIQLLRRTTCMNIIRTAYAQTVVLAFRYNLGMVVCDFYIRIITVITK